MFKNDNLIILKCNINYLNNSIPIYTCIKQNVDAGEKLLESFNISNQNNVNITLNNGLGDKLLDLIGFFILCKYLNYKPNITFNNNDIFAWGNNNYDIRLFNFNDIIILKDDDKTDYYVTSPVQSASLCPYKVYKFIKQFINEVSFEQISNDFVIYSKKIIAPSEIILSQIPNDIEKAYGIHLRKSDKLHDNGRENRYENSMSEFKIITSKLLEDVKNIIINENEVKFLIVSEDINWKKEITNIIIDISNKNNKQIKILDIDYDNKNNYNNNNSVLDMFCLSKCKEILQGVKYSTFSILASLLGNNKLRNYSNYTDSYDICFIHNWSSVLEINNKPKNFIIEFHEKNTDNVTNINTNITKIYN